MPSRPPTTRTETISRLEPMGSLAAETSGALLKDASVRLDAALRLAAARRRQLLPAGLRARPAANSEGALSSHQGAGAPARREGADPHRLRAGRRRPHGRSAPRHRHRARRAVHAAEPEDRIHDLCRHRRWRQAPSASSSACWPSCRCVAGVPSPGADAGNTAARRGVCRPGRADGQARWPADRIRSRCRSAPTDRWSTGSSPWHVAFELPAGDYIMRCVVREPGGIVGSADRRFMVRSLNGVDVAATDFVIASPGDPLPVRAVALQRRHA